MPVPSKISRFADDIKQALAERVLVRNESYQKTADWLLETYGVKTSKSALQVFAKKLQLDFADLINLGMPVKEIAKNEALIKALGIEAVKRELIDRLNLKNGGLFDYLDNQQGNP